MMEKASEESCTKQSKEKVDTDTRGILMGGYRRMKKAVIK
jgi:hypothetical protein